MRVVRWVGFCAACIILLSGLFRAAHAGNVKSGVNLWVDTNSSNAVTFVSNGGSAYPGGVGSAASNLPFEGGWGCSSGSILWKDTNGTDTLRMDCGGLDILNPGGIANSNGSKSGNVTLTANTAVGLRLRNTYNFGKSSYTDTIFLNGGTTFTVAGCVGVGTPDLHIDMLTVSDNTLDPFQKFTISTTARNSGQGTCDASTLSYRLSTNDFISTSDTQLATDSVGALDSNGISGESAEVDAPDYGVYWVGACLESVVGESNTSNNCKNFTGNERNQKIEVGDCRTPPPVENQTVSVMTSFQGCQELGTGSSLTVTTSLGANFYGGETVKFGNGLAVNDGAQLTAYICGQDICSTGSPPPNSCMPCVTTVCAADPFCCNTQWDKVCVNEVSTLCRLPCP